MWKPSAGSPLNFCARSLTFSNGITTAWIFCRLRVAASPLLVTSADALPAIAEELKGLANVRWKSEKALVCLVGEKVRRQPEIAAQVFRALADVDLRMICQGASERNISFLVDESKAEDSVRRLHRLFFQSRFDRYSASQ